MNPIVSMCRETLSVDKVVLTPTLFYNMTADLELDIKWLLKVKEVNQLYMRYGNEEFMRCANESGMIRINPKDQQVVEFILDDSAMKRCHVIMVNPGTVEITDELIAKFEFCQPMEKLGMMHMYFVGDAGQADQMVEKMKELGVKSVKKQLESKRDAYIRWAGLCGVTKQQIKDSQFQFQKIVNKNAYLSNPKEQGYQKSTEEFKQESGYVNMKVQTYNLEAELDEIFKQGLEKPVEFLVKDAPIFTEPQAQLWAARVKVVQKRGQGKAAQGQEQEQSEELKAEEPKAAELPQEQ